jgi:hypothetical protein
MHHAKAGPQSIIPFFDAYTGNPEESHSPLTTDHSRFTRAFR